MDRKTRKAWRKMEKQVQREQREQAALEKEEENPTRCVLHIRPPPRSAEKERWSAKRRELHEVMLASDALERARDMVQRRRREVFCWLCPFCGTYHIIEPMDWNMGVRVGDYQGATFLVKAINDFDRKRLTEPDVEELRTRRALVFPYFKKQPEITWEAKPEIYPVYLNRAKMTASPVSTLFDTYSLDRHENENSNSDYVSMEPAFTDAGGGQKLWIQLDTDACPTPIIGHADCVWLVGLGPLANERFCINFVPEISTMPMMERGQVDMSIWESNTDTRQPVEANDTGAQRDTDLRIPEGRPSSSLRSLRDFFQFDVTPFSFDTPSRDSMYNHLRAFVSLGRSL